MEFTLEFFTCIVVTIFSILLILDLMWKPKINVPSPKRIPLLGHIFYMTKNPHLKLTAWANQLGNMFTIQNLNKTTLVLNGYEAIHEALVTKGKETGGRFKQYREWILMGENDFMSHDVSPRWKELRHFVHLNLKQYGQGMMHIESIMQEISDDIVNNLSSLNGQACDPYSSMYAAVVNSLSSMFSGRKYEMNDPIIKKWMEIERLTNMHVAPFGKGMELEYLPWLRHFGNDAYKMLIHVTEERHGIFTSLKDVYQHEGDKEQLIGLAFDFLKELDNEKGTMRHYLNEKLVENIMFDLMVAGMATSSKSLYTFLTVMSTYKEIQHTMAEEIKAQLKNKTDSSNHNNNRIELSDRDNMPYTRAILLELQRYASIVPLGLPHKTMSDVVIQGVKIPKNTSLITNLWGLHHDPTFWEKPMEFNPERFLDEHGILIPSDNPKRKRILAFGAGTRVCLGQSLAMARLFIFTTSIVQNFDIELVNPIPGCDDPRTYEFGVSLTPNPCEFRFINRC